jgi:hypothetical protein
MSTCPTCGCEPCINPGFCVICRQADERKRRGHVKSVGSRAVTPRAPAATVEALVHSLRERGVWALTETAVKLRLAELTNDQLLEVAGRLQRLKPEIARAWTPDEVKQLFRSR